MPITPIIGKEIMMMRCVTQIIFQQVGNGRSGQFTFDFVNKFECEYTWKNMTNKGKIIIPKNVYVIDQDGNPYNLYGTNNPDNLIDTLFQRGDRVSIAYGYYTYDTAGNESLQPLDPATKQLQVVFTGYISKVHSKIPVELEIEDNMWALKQIPCTPQVWPYTQTVEGLLNALLSGQTYVNGALSPANAPVAVLPGTNTPITVNALTQTTIGDFIIQNETVAQVLARLRKDYHLECYFKGSELRIGSLVYVESEAVTSVFHFQGNVVKDSLEFQRMDDVKLSAVCSSLIFNATGVLNKKGQAKTIGQQLEVLVTSNGSGGWNYVQKQKNVPFPDNEEGERRSLFFFNITDPQDLATLGSQDLTRYYYIGFKGDFATFALPYVKCGDNIWLTDNFLPDRNGLYKVKGVKYTGGVDGHQQIISLDYKISS